jgi:putative molybdopterin biosynthesis protein
VAEERYDLILPKKFLENPMIITLLDIIMNNSTFRQTVENLGGYNLRDCGKVMYEQ